ncbi:MAG: CHAT domain-containing protein, partial [Flammeovirgaceae bacterium]|nr:CHAT domain-containing protein [Flammeovirgaceae bacterium]
YLYLLANNPKKAEHYFTLSQTLREKNLPRRSVFRAYPVVGLAELAIKQHEDDKALLLLYKAEKMMNRATTSFYSGESLYKNIQFNKAELLFRKKDYKQLPRVIDKLFSGGSIFALTSNNEVRSQVPKVFEMQARYYLETGDLEKAEEFLKKARAFSKTFRSSMTDFSIQRTGALLHWAKNDATASAQALKNLTGSYKNFVVDNFSSMSEHEKEDFFLLLKADFDLLNAFILGNQNHEQASVFFEWAYNNQLFSKALLLNETNKLKNQITTSGDEELKRVFNEWEDVRARLSAMHYQKKKDQIEITRLENQVESLEKILNQRSSVLKTYSEEITWRNVQGTLQEGEAAVEIIRLKQFSITDQKQKFRFTDSVFYLVLCVEKNSVHPKGFFITDGTMLESRFLTFYRNCTMGKINDTVSYNAFWKPIKNKLPGVRKIYLSADGVYNQINLSTLRNPDTRNYLLNELDFVFVTNTKDLLLASNEQSNPNASLYGRPSYRMDEEQIRQKDTESTIKVREIRSENLDNFREQSFSDLPGTETEISKIQELLKSNQWGVNYRTGFDASETNLKSEKGTPVLHIATHGFFLSQKEGEEINSMIRSGIILAGVNNEQSANDHLDDGILTAYEATSLNLEGTNLVVLSACETGLGDTKNGIGVYGLQRGFTVAGAKHLLMSLWKVDDRSTNLLMQYFYSEWLAGEEIHQAIKKAQLKMMTEYPHPYYWGPFILLGK